MDTLMEFKNKGGSWLAHIRKWIQRNARNGSSVKWGSNDELHFNRAISVSDLEGLAGVIAHSVYEDYYIKDKYVKELKRNLKIDFETDEEHILFINFLKQQGITAQFSLNLRSIRHLEITEYLLILKEKKIDLEYVIFMAFSWNLKDINESHDFWEYQSNQWKRKLNKFRGD